MPVVETLVGLAIWVFFVVVAKVLLQALWQEIIQPMCVDETVALHDVLAVAIGCTVLLTPIALFMYWTGNCVFHYDNHWYPGGESSGFACIARTFLL